MVAYNTISVPVFTSDAITNAGKFPLYDSLDEDVLKSYMEYSLASLIFYAMKVGPQC